MCDGEDEDEDEDQDDDDDDDNDDNESGCAELCYAVLACVCYVVSAVCCVFWRGQSSLDRDAKDITHGAEARALMLQGCNMNSFF